MEEESHEGATRILTEIKSTLGTLAELLLEKELLSGKEVTQVKEKASASSS